MATKTRSARKPVTVTKVEKAAKGDGGKKHDRFGCRLGTVRAKCNACLGAKPKTAAAIAEATGYPTARVSSVLSNAIKRGLPITKTDKGYALAGK